MTVVLIRFPDAGAARNAADVLGKGAEKGTDAFLGARECKKAGDRPGKGARLSYAEMKLAFDLRAEMFPRVRPIMEQGMKDAEAMREYDRANIRPGDRVRQRLREKGVYKDFREEPEAG